MGTSTDTIFRKPNVAVSKGEIPAVSRTLTASKNKELEFVAGNVNKL